MSLAVIIFGITGDLSQHKLIPSLWQLYERQSLPPETHFFGYGRKPFEQTEFQSFIQSATPNALPEFIGSWHYQQGQIDDESAYVALANKLNNFDERLIYLAVGPNLYETIINTAVTTKLLQKNANHKVIIEKPFGSSEASARKLNNFLTQRLDESQIFRIDHYLGKPGLREFITKPSTPVDSITVTMTDTSGVGERGAFYDATGIVRDVVQNHMLEVLATVLAWARNLEPTPTNRAEQLSHLEVTFSELGQYEGYRSEKNVKTESQTETSAHLELTSHTIKVHLLAERRAAKNQSDIVLSHESQPTIISLSDIPDQLSPHAQLILEALQNKKDWFASFEEAIAAWQIIDPILANKQLTEY